MYSSTLIKKFNETVFKPLESHNKNGIKDVPSISKLFEEERANQSTNKVKRLIPHRMLRLIKIANQIIQYGSTSEQTLPR